MDTPSTQKLSQVHPHLQQGIQNLFTALLAQDISCRVVQGLRSWEDQAKIYAQGRTAPGEIVSNAPPGHSMHEFGLAVDCMPSLNTPDLPYDPDGVGGSLRYLTMREITESLGLVSGSRWSKPDWPHIQLPNMPASPTGAMRDDFGRGGLDLVWANYDTGEYA